MVRVFVRVRLRVRVSVRFRVSVVFVVVVSVQVRVRVRVSYNPHFLAHVYCRQTTGWIKMPFGMTVHVGPGHIVLDGNPA